LINCGGIIYGFVKGFVIVTVLFAIVLLASPMIDEKYINTINDSTIGKFMYNHNLLIGSIK
jgi:L-lactate permease